MQNPKSSPNNILNPEIKFLIFEYFNFNIFYVPDI